jgi:RNA polymerase sigma factor (sigma-70 family)
VSADADIDAALPYPVEPSAPCAGRDSSMITDLVSGARKGDQRAWDALVACYAPLIWSICRGYRLSDADAEDVGQSVWLHLVDRLGKVRDPAALAGWLATTTRRECTRVRRKARETRAAGPDIEIIAAKPTETAGEDLLAAEHHAALCEALADLPPAGRHLMALLAADPPLPYAVIGVRLGLPAGRIGPARARYLNRLRRHPALAALIEADSSR